MSLISFWESLLSSHRTRIFMVLSILLFVVLIMIVVWPSRREAYVRNLQRQRDVAFIGNVVRTYKKTEQRLPEGMDATPKQICRSYEMAACADAIVLPYATVQTFATSTPWLGDPTASSTRYLGYLIAASSTAADGFAIYAPSAELGVRIVYPR